MGNPVDGKPNGVSDSAGAPASSKVTANTRVNGAAGPLGILTDVPSFGGATVTGVWTLGSLRAKVNGIPMVTSAAVGIGVASSVPPGTTGPLRLQQSDDRIKVL